jgi:hypothetical protein
VPDFIKGVTGFGIGDVTAVHHLNDVSFSSRYSCTSFHDILIGKTTRGARLGELWSLTGAGGNTLSLAHGHVAKGLHLDRSSHIRRSNACLEGFMAGIPAVVSCKVLCAQRVLDLSGLGFGLCCPKFV